MPKNATDTKSKKNLVLVIAVYALTLFVGTAYILWQYTYLFNIGVLGFSLIGDFSFGFVLTATFTLNFIIQIAVCPAMLRAITPRLKSWGVYSGTFADWRSQHKKPN